MRTSIASGQAVGRAGGILTPGEDIFIIAGESNPEGRGASGESPTVPAGQGYAFTDLNTKVHLSDPVGGANTGSAWPAFAISYYNISKRVPIILECARGSAVITNIPNINSFNYSNDAGSLYHTSITRTDDCLAAHPNIVRPMGTIWNAGVNDAAYMDANPSYTKAIVKAGFYNLIDRYKAKYVNTPFYIIKTFRYEVGYTAGCIALNEIQDEAAADYSHVHICYSATNTFTVANGKMKLDETHYAQPGLNEIGTDSGVFIFNNQVI